MGSSVDYCRKTYVHFITCVSLFLVKADMLWGCQIASTNEMRFSVAIVDTWSVANKITSEEWQSLTITGRHRASTPRTRRQDTSSPAEPGHFDSIINSSLTQTSHNTSVVVLEESPCPRGSSRTNFQVLVLVLVLGRSSPRKFSRTA